MSKHKKCYASGEWGGSYDCNVYSDPEACGLKIVAAVEAEQDWDFHVAVLFQDLETGSLWLCYDQGCSCPVPFEEVRSFSSMTSCRSERGIDKFLNEHWVGRSDSAMHWDRAEINEFRRKARAAVRKWKKGIS